MSHETPDPSEPSPPDEAPLKSSRVPDWLPNALVLGAILVFAAAASVQHVHRYTKFSPVDELQHYDYLLKAPDGHVVVRGELIDDEALREEACRGLDFDLPIPKCDSTVLDRTAFQNASVNTAYIHPPLYYFLSGQLARALGSVFSIDSELSAGRITGAAWLVAAVILTWLAMTALGCSLFARAAATLCMVTAPMALFSAATVTPDATALAAGAGMLFLAVKYEQNRVPGWALVVAGLAAVLVRINNLFGVAVVSLFLAARVFVAGHAGTSRGRNAILVACMTLGLPGLVGAGWFAYAESRGPELSVNEDFVVDHFPLARVVDQLTATLTPLHGAYVPQFLGPDEQAVLIRLLEILLIGALVGGMIWAQRGSVANLLATATFVCMLAAGPLLAAAGTLSGVFIPIPGRYGLAMVPAAFTVLAIGLRSRLTLALTFAFATWSVVRVGLAIT